FGCQWVGCRKGSEDVGQVDVFGVRTFRERFSNRYLIIGVEVKPKTFHFGKKLGQALGYSLFAHKVYLACKEEFTVTQVELASKLGAGLIQIKKKSGCAEVLGSRMFEPDKEKMLKLMMKLGLGECVLCGSVFSFDDGYSANLHRAAENGLPYELRRGIDAKDFPSFKGSRSRTSQYLYLCNLCNRLFKEGQYKFK
ncbi:MAG: hypothetical protein ABSE90_08230, partial [Verrucomicrobiota bacterium]